MNTRIEKPGGGDEFDRYVEAAVAQERRMWEERMDVAYHETRAVREQNERLMRIICGVMELLPPPPMESGGQTWVFQDPNANSTLRELRARIAAISESVHVIRNSQIMALVGGPGADTSPALPRRFTDAKASGPSLRREV